MKILNSTKFVPPKNASDSNACFLVVALGQDLRLQPNIEGGTKATGAHKVSYTLVLGEISPSGLSFWLTLQHLHTRIISLVKPNLTLEFTFIRVLPLGIFLNLSDRDSGIAHQTTGEGVMAGSYHRFLCKSSRRQGRGFLHEL